MKLSELPQLVTIPSVSEQYGIPKKIIYRWVKNHQIPYYKIGPRMIRFDVKEVEQIIKKQKLDKERKSL